MSFDPERPPLPPHLVVEVGGRLRTEPEDFVVEEIPAYLPSGEGEHAMALVEKRGLTTMALLERVASSLGLRARDLGCAGYKDRHALTRQWISAPARCEDALRRLELPGLRVLEVARHRNKIKLGHLKGNRFEISVREVDAAALPHVQAVLEAVAREGLPNGFGPQRFGTCRNNHLLGAALVRRDSEAFLALAGTPSPAFETPRMEAARRALQDGSYEAALALFPREMTLERHLAAALLKTGDRAHAVASIPRRLRDFLLSAWQSALFNQVLERRLDTYDRLLDGDLAMKHANGACFLVEDPALEQPRCDAQEISPTGPMPGPRMLRPRGAAAVIEDAVLAAAGADAAALAASAGLEGARRALRVPVADPTAAFEDGRLLLRFTLPPGSFATTLLALFGFVEAE